MAWEGEINKIFVEAFFYLDLEKMTRLKSKKSVAKWSKALLVRENKRK